VRCPSCNTDTMAELRQEGVDLDFCSSCKGIWFDEGEVAFYVETTQDIPALATAMAGGQETSKACPRCVGVSLKEVKYVPDADLLIDVCPACKGVFLDKGELPHLEHLSRRLEAGGKVNRTMQSLEKMGYLVLGGEARKA